MHLEVRKHNSIEISCRSRTIESGRIMKSVPESIMMPYLPKEVSLFRITLSPYLIYPISDPLIAHHISKSGFTLKMYPGPIWIESSIPHIIMIAEVPAVQILNIFLAALYPNVRLLKQIFSISSLSGSIDNPHIAPTCLSL